MIPPQPQDARFVILLGTLHQNHDAASTTKHRRFAFSSRLPSKNSVSPKLHVFLVNPHQNQVQPRTAARQILNFPRDASSKTWFVRAQTRPNHACWTRKIALSLGTLRQNHYSLQPDRAMAYRSFDGESRVKLEIRRPKMC